MTYQITSRTPTMVANPKTPSTIYVQSKEAGTVRIEADRNNLLRVGPGGILEGITLSLGDGIVPFSDWMGPMYSVSDVDDGILVEFVIAGDQPR